MNAVQYLQQLKGKPIYQEEYNRLESILCDEDRKELADRDMECICMCTSLPFNSFTKKTRHEILIVRRDPDRARTVWDYKLVHWDGTTLTEENGKQYSWDHNPYLDWAGIS